MPHSQKFRRSEKLLQQGLPVRENKKENNTPQTFPKGAPAASFNSALLIK
jgi:hypothetical protein